jgi:hypothetical protein
MTAELIRLRSPSYRTRITDTGLQDVVKGPAEILGAPPGFSGLQRALGIRVFVNLPSHSPTSHLPGFSLLQARSSREQPNALGAPVAMERSGCSQKRHDRLWTAAVPLCPC